MTDDKLKFQYSAVRWVVEHQLLDDPQVMNHLAMNVYAVSSSIKDAEFLLGRDQKQLLVYVGLSWFGRTFKKKVIFQDVEHILSQLLPSFKLRVISDPQLFNLALEKVKKALGTKSKL